MLESFYVYKELTPSEKWETVLDCVSVANLPNISFGIAIRALNKKEALTKAIKVYDRVHQKDLHKDTVREFMKSIISNHEAWKKLPKSILNLALDLSKDYEEYCESIKETIDFAPMEEEK